jgi:ribonucleoside-diphosphate reductase alpha chain
METKRDFLSAERKRLQKEGLLPDWYTTDAWGLFKSKYMEGSSSFKDRIQTIAKTAAKHAPGNKAHWEKQFFDVIWKGWLSPSTPALANLGTNKGMPVACSGQYIADSVASFYGELLDTAVLTKNGFGTSAYLGDIRPRGSAIATGGSASGVVPVFQTYVDTMKRVTQGVARRGAWAGYLPIDHPDFVELAEWVKNNPDDANVGWCVSDEFIEALNAGDPEAIARYQKAMKLKMLTGKGYFFFNDKVNRQRPDGYPEVLASNLCVAPETLVLTDKGHLRIDSIVGEHVNVWNGEEWSNVKIVKTGEDQKLVTVRLSNGLDIDCTPYHKFYVSINGRIQEKRAHELEEGDKLIKSKFPVIDNEDSRDLECAYSNGFYSADGCLLKNGRHRLYFYGEKRDLIGTVSHEIAGVKIRREENRSIIDLSAGVLRPKFYVPTPTFNVKSRLRWFEGLCDGDGTVARNGATQSLQIASVNPEFLREVQLMLQTMGVDSKVTLARKAGRHSLPANDGTGENKEYDCQDLYRLLIGQTGIVQLRWLGFAPKRLKLTGHVPDRECSHFTVVTDVIDNGRIDDTYCFVEPKRHMGVFNGILTGQCTEITLHSSDTETFTCVLASMNLEKYDEWMNTDAVYIATVFLDCVASEFIEKAKGIRGFEKAVLSTERSRALGLGVLGFHSLLHKRRIPFDSYRAKMLNKEVFQFINDESLMASADLANEFGKCYYATDSFPVRNTHRLAVAPTMSTSQLMGGTSQGIEPYIGNVFVQQGAGGETIRVVPELLEIMKANNVYSRETLLDIASKDGSVQHVDWLTDDEKAVFKTAFEINQNVLLDLASDRQKYICQGQSINLFFGADDPEEYISEVHKRAFLDENILSLYYVRTKAGVSASSGECVACHA